MWHHVARFLQTGGAIYLCPGTYRGNFVLSARCVVDWCGARWRRRLECHPRCWWEWAHVGSDQHVTATVHSVRITGGNLPAESGGGGGVHNAGSLTITACTIRNNSAEYGGGIVQRFTATGPLNITNCTITKNVAEERGGGVYIEGTKTVTILDSTISENEAGAFGGGVSTSGTGLVLIGGSAMAENTAFSGGGIYNLDATVALDEGSTITGNEATNTNGGIGGIDNDLGTVTLNGATVSGTPRSIVSM